MLLWWWWRWWCVQSHHCVACLPTRNALAGAKYRLRLVWITDRLTVMDLCPYIVTDMDRSLIAPQLIPKGVSGAVVRLSAAGEGTVTVQYSTVWWSRRVASLRCFQTAIWPCHSIHVDQPTFKTCFNPPHFTFKHASLSESFETLVDGVQLNLEPSNRDKFTQKITFFRRDVLKYISKEV